MPTHARPTDPLGAFMIGPERLAAGRQGGPLAGVRFAAKDLFDVAGMRTGAGNPDWLEDALVAAEHAPAVGALLAAGADLWGKTVTDELAFSLSGTNCHYGTPLNSRAPGRIPGGSSSGSASAVAGGAVELALGTDTAGSVRVPASYCGIFGLRPTHGRIDASGVVPLAPSFDTVGLLAVDGPVLAAGWRAMLAGAASHPTAAFVRPRALRRLVLASDLLELVDEATRAAVVSAATGLAGQLRMDLIEARLSSHGGSLAARGASRPGELAGWRDSFRVVQLVEAWQAHGAWITGQQPSFGPGIAARFGAAAAASPQQAERARAVRADVHRCLARFLGDDAVLVQPSASGPAPPFDMTPEAKDELRGRTLTLTAPAGMVGAPVLSLPLAEVDGLPVGVALVGLPGDDDALVEIAGQVSRPFSP
ncbi:MAG: amidase [Acidimicrobiales bacterium]